MSLPLVAGVVDTVRMVAPEALFTGLGPNEHTGGIFVAGEPLRVMLLQAKVTSPPNQLIGDTLIVDVTGPPGLTVEGESAEADTWNPGGTVSAETFKSVATPVLTVPCRSKILVLSPIARSGRPSRSKSATSAR